MIDHAKTDHIFHEIRRSVAVDFPNLTLNYIFVKNGEDSVSDHVKALPDHKAKDLMIIAMQKPISNKTNLLALTYKPNIIIPFIPLYRDNSYLATLIINEEQHTRERDFFYPEEPEKYDRFIGLALAWEAIHLMQAHKQKEEAIFDDEDGVLTYAKIKTLRLRNAMLRECFACMYMEQEGETGAVQRHLRRSCEITVSQHMHTTPENRPFPIAIDATRLVFRALRKYEEDIDGPIVKHTYNMVKEIDSTCEDLNLRQWFIFAKYAQEMAWSERNKHEILSSAAYSSDDPYIRTTAYIVAETLNSNLTPLNNPQFFNPYDDKDKTHRMHLKKAQALYKPVIEEAAQLGKPEILIKHAIEQTKAFIYHHDILGWAAPALIKANNSYSDQNTDPTKLYEIFLLSLKELDWTEVYKIHAFIISKQRMNIYVTPEMILEEHIGNNNERQIFKEAIKLLTHNNGEI